MDFTFLQALNSQLNLKSKRFRQLLPSRLQMIKRCTTTKTRCTLPSCSTFWIFSNSYDGKVEFLGTCIVEEGIYRTQVYLGSDLWVRVSETHKQTDLSETYTSYTSYTSHLVAKFATNASGAICWTSLQLMQVTQPGGKICN